MSKCSSTRSNVQCELEQGHASIKKISILDGKEIGIPHKGVMADGRTMSWLDQEHCNVFGHSFASSGQCISCGSHRDPVYR